MTEWQRNTGHRPGILKDSDKVHVRLNTGNEAVWPVSSRHGSIQWGLDYPVHILEWRKA